MIVISSREFRANQKKYFDLVDKLKQVIVQRGKNKAYVLTPVSEADRISASTEFAKIVKQAEKEYKNGETVTMNSDELSKFLEVE